MSETKDCFHVNSLAHWAPLPRMKIGDHFDVGGDYNPFFKYFDTPAQIRTEVGGTEWVPMMDVAMNLNAKRVTHKDPFGLAFATLKHVAMLCREMIVEVVRSEQFPHLPSRQKCIWLVDSVDEAEQFAKQATKTAYQIVKIRATGSHHLADANLLPFCFSGYSDERRLAERYWRGEMVDGPFRERLFVGSVEVLDVVKTAGPSW